MYDAQLYTKQLSPSGRGYLNHRGLTDATIAKYEIGEARSYMNEKATLAGKPFRIKKTNKKNSYGFNPHHHPVFIERIMFPIRDEEGAVVGFSGRAYKEEVLKDYPKYMNSSDSITYDKSSTLFGLEHCVGKKIITVVEGQFCCCTINQALGWDVVSTLSKLTEEHAKIIAKKDYKKAIVIGDNDNAGRLYNINSGLLLIKKGISVAIGIAPEGIDDPSQNGGLKGYTYKPFFEYVLDFIKDFPVWKRLNYIHQNLEGYPWELADISIIKKYQWLPTEIKDTIMWKYVKIASVAIEGEEFGLSSLERRIMEKDPLLNWFLNERTYLVIDEEKEEQYFHNKTFTAEEELKFEFLMKLYADTTADIEKRYYI